MSGKQILIIEDEDDIAEVLSYNLTREGFVTTRVATGEEGLDKVRDYSPDLVLLDLMLPGVDGLEVCRQMRYDVATRDIPVIMLTAKSEDMDVVTGFEVGANDYVSKPFSPKVLIARIRALLRRNTGAEKGEPKNENRTIHVHELKMDPGRQEVIVRNKNLKLTYTEFKVLYFLASKPGWVYSRSEIVSAVHGDDYPVTDRAMDVLVVGLRKKLGDFSDYIETVRGVGYRFRE